jgi:Ni,Fe-hydrogenase III large subunit/Ni,Fe-hydrogenase III component G
MNPPLPLPAQQIGSHRAVVDTTANDLARHAATLNGAGYRLALIAAHDDPPAAPLRVVYLYTAGAQQVELHLPVDRDSPTVPTLAALSYPASRFEREMQDLYGIHPDGHPQPRHLVRHRHWPQGWYPMRHDAGPPPPFGQTDVPFPFVNVEGAGVYEIPVGPVHAGLIEPGHFRFSVVGETIVRLKARLWYVHKGTEKLFEGRQPTDGLELAERISGDTAVGHTLAYCRAVEDALGIEIPAAATRARAVLLALERLYNHVSDIGALCNDVGHSILNAHALRIKESLLRINHDTTGHRLLRGGVHIGGATIRHLPDAAQLRRIADDIRDVVDLALANSLVAERFTGTAVLTPEQAHEVGTLGYVARASGITTNSGVDQPPGGHGSDDELIAAIPATKATGDVMARFRQRVTEIQASLRLLDELIPTVPAETLGLTDRPRAVPAPGHATSGVGAVEAWRGTIVHRVELGPDHRLTRNKIVDPSFFNWPALPLALTNTIVSDFPLANKSFNLSYAGNDL